MRDNLRLITPASDLAVSLDEAKRHLRVEDGESDALIAAYLEAAEQSLAYLGRALMPASYALDVYCWRREIELPMPPLRTVSAVKTLGPDGTTLIVADASTYSVRTSAEGRGLVFLPGMTVSPVAYQGRPVASVEFSAGYDIVPAAIRAAILLMVGTLFDNRADASPISIYSLPAAARLLAPYAEPVA